MLTYGNDDENPTTDREAYYEIVASQEEIYLEETEEAVHMALETADPCFSNEDVNGSSRLEETLNEQLHHAAEELIAGDADDPPLSPETITGMLSTG